MDKVARILAIWINREATGATAAGMASQPNRAICMFLNDMDTYWDRWGIVRIASTYNSNGKQCPCLYVTSTDLTMTEVEPFLAHYGLVGEFVQ